MKLPSVAELCDALKSCKEWISKHRALAKVYAQRSCVYITYNIFSLEAAVLFILVLTFLFLV